MDTMRKNLLIGLAVMAVLAVAAPVGSASAATHNISLHCALKAGHGNPDPGRFAGKPFGSGRLSQLQTLAVYKEIFTLTLYAKAGSVKLAITGAPRGNHFYGTWKATGGTGEYKRIRGKGKLVGQENVLNLTGTVTY
jgi:hypothetical protein